MQVRDQEKTNLMVMEKHGFKTMNCIIMDGIVHALATKEKACPDNPSNNPCEMCTLREYCPDFSKPLCHLFDASSDEFFAIVGHWVKISSEKCEIRAYDGWKTECPSTLEEECP